MVSYLVRRVLLTIPILLAVLTLVFLLVRVAPGDPAVAALGDYASQEAVEALRVRMGLDRPLWQQYFDFLGGLLRGDLGVSLISRVPVSAQVERGLPHTFLLTLSGVVVGIMLGVPLGVLNALKRNTLADYLGRTFSLAGLSVPAFYLGILLLLVFSIRLRWLPVVGAGDFADPISILRHLLLPALTLGLIMTAYVTRMTRSTLLNILGEDYVRTARAKGVSERLVTYHHAFRNALIPIISVVGIHTVELIGSSVMVEMVFSRPGLGRLMVGAMTQRDYISLQSLMVIYAGLVVFVNLVTDLSYGFVDPRIKYE